MPNGETCPHHTTLAVQVARHEQRIDDMDERTHQLEHAVADIRSTMARGVGAIAVLVFLLSIFGEQIAKAIFR